jgi:hypothetical protein
MSLRFRITSALTAFFLLTGTTILPARAASSVPIASVVGFRTSGSEFEKQFRQYLSDELKASERFKLVADSMASSSVDEIWTSQQKGTTDTLKEAFQNYIKGKKLYESLEVDDAIKALSASVKGYREGVAALKDNRYLLASHLYLGMALVIRGNVPEGREYIRQMIVLDANRFKDRLPQREFPPKIVNLHTELTQEVLKGPSGTVSVRIKPFGAKVYLDGVPQETTSPVDIRNVPVGEHFIVAEKKGFGRYWQRLAVQTGNNAVDARLDEWPLILPYPFSMRGDQDATDALAQLGNNLNSNVLVLGRFSEPGIEQGGVQAQLFDVRSKEFSRVEEIAFSADRTKKTAEELAKKLVGDLSNDGLVMKQLNADVVPSFPTSQAESPRYREYSASKPFYKTWWFWTIVGVAAAGGASTLLFVRPTPDYRIVNVQNPLP